MATRLNWLRAAVLGANDGIVSTAGLVVGVAGATSSRTAILTAGLAGLGVTAGRKGRCRLADCSCCHDPPEGKDGSPRCG
jgi:VIT1/CCC1 family predicted Fe2+/Mn2+ transporter